MSNLWLLKFMPYEGPLCHALFFKTREAALQKRKEAYLSVGGQCLFLDDFGIELSIDPSKCVIVLTDCLTSASFESAFRAADEAAKKKYNLPLAAPEYNTLQ